jgi:phage/plasmid-associated DNA primase
MVLFVESARLEPASNRNQATKHYLISQTALLACIEKRYDLHKSFNSITRDLYPDYKAWAKSANEYVLSEKRFTNAMLNMGFPPWTDSRSRRHGFTGIALKASNDELPMWRDETTHLTGNPKRLAHSASFAGSSRSERQLTLRERSRAGSSVQ